MGVDFLPYAIETTRGTKPGAPAYKFLRVTKGIVPKVNYKDEVRKQFMGVNSSLGYPTATRKDQSFAHSIEAIFSPEEFVDFFKFVMGHAGVRATIDTDGYKGLMYPVRMPYGAGNPLLDQAMLFSPNTDEEGVTKSQDFGGERPFSITIKGKQGEDVTITIELKGAGDWIGAPDQAATPNPVFSVRVPYTGQGVAWYIGAGAARTGTAPDFTDIAPGTMDRFYPDEFTIKITNGLDDKAILNGIVGPSKTVRNKAFEVEIDFTMDYNDPTSGFSSAAEFKRLATGITMSSLMCILDNFETINTTETYQTLFDIPRALFSSDAPERDVEGKTPSLKMKYKSMIDPAIGYPIAVQTKDKTAAY
jgi:hypothetical protein